MFGWIRKFFCNKPSSRVPEKDKRDPLRYHEWIDKNLEKSVIQIIDHSKFSDIKEIGKGAHGTAFSAEYNGVKIVYKETKDSEIKKIVNEIKQHMTVNKSEYIIKFLGITRDFKIVLQYANGGTLRKHLENKISDSIFKISWEELIKIAEQVIYGLRDLHENNVVHGDLHPKNILTHDDNGKFKVVIADFGSASKLDDSLISIHQEYFTLEYADPQLFIDPQMVRPNCKSDIYSLGVILWELTSGIRPFSKIPNKIALANHIARGKREKMVPGTPSSYAKLCEKCWRSNPKKRPELKEILLKLGKSKDVKKIISNKIRR
ncbi:kinase-like domain-containing protein [Gigaspora rosea]|uniref:Kinase-like domain-containing protein n=1 Tax=Gigaspora rosea TaxID=44941 RepID=A0A397UKT4_9GLOM|nr:kinase-like domain-containing protein [Gigaspora rosea]